MTKKLPIAKGLSLIQGTDVNRLSFEHNGKKAMVDLETCLRYSGSIVRSAVFGWCQNFAPQSELSATMHEMQTRSEALAIAYPEGDESIYGLQDHYRLEMDHIGSAAIALILYTREEAAKNVKS